MVLIGDNPKSRWPALPAESNEGPAVRLYQTDDDAPHRWAVSAGRVTSFSVRSPEKQTPNEDALAVIDRGDGAVVLVVADGMGGQAAGEVAARLTVDAVHAAVQQISGDEQGLRGAIIDGIENANREVIALANGAGATVAVACVSDSHFRSFHVGDSAILLMGQRGRVKFESIAHSPVGYAEASGLLQPEEALQHDERHLISNFVGTAQMRIEIGPELAMARYDTLLLATDGLTDNVLVGEAVSTMRAGPLAQCARSLANLARQRMVEQSPGLPSKPDDLSFLAFRRG